MTRDLSRTSICVQGDVPHPPTPPTPPHTGLAVCFRPLCVLRSPLHHPLNLHTPHRPLPHLTVPSHNSPSPAHLLSGLLPALARAHSPFHRFSNFQTSPLPFFAIPSHTPFYTLSHLLSGLLTALARAQVALLLARGQVGVLRVVSLEPMEEKLSPR